jgi:hypothetical protein
VAFKNIVLVDWLALLLHVREVSDPNLGLETVAAEEIFVIFLSPSRQMPE